MSVRRILAKTIDTDLEYEAIGIDLAKNCVSAALLTTDGEVVCIDRLDYSELEKSAQALSSTTFAMEPCTEMNYPEFADLFYAYGVLDSGRFIGESSHLVGLGSNQASFYLRA